MNSCVRCEKPIGDREVHIFWGGEERRKALETEIGFKVSLCDFPMPRVENPILCTCGRYMFDFDVPCPMCGKTYLEAKEEPGTKRSQALDAFKTALGSDYPVRWVDGHSSKGDFSGRDFAVDVFNVPVNMQRELLRKLRDAREFSKALLGERCIFIFHTPEATERHYKDLL